MAAENLGSILVVDDEQPLVAALCAVLQQEGYDVEGHVSANAALAALQPGRYELLITDLQMPQMDGMALLQAALRIDPTLAGVVMTGHGTVDIAVKALHLGALDFMQKPFNLDLVRTVVTRALQIRRLRLENAALLAREREHLRELEAAYQGLDAFSVSISHDLRAPLRAIIGFTSACLADHADNLPEEARRQLDLVVKSGTRMGRMIEDLLRFCRCSRQPLHKSQVNTAALVAGVVEDLRACLAPHAPRVVVQNMPACDADRSLLEQVFVNLLSNAFKFTRHTAAPCIEVSTAQADGNTVFCVRDNGAGFDMRYAERLFGVFCRLHSEREFEGTGVGLSIVRRIVERHGGRIWAESAPGAGATFRFTLAG